MTNRDLMRAACAKHGIEENALTTAVAARGIPDGDADYLVERFLNGGPTAMIVAVAILDLIVSQEMQTRH